MIIIRFFMFLLIFSGLFLFIYDKMKINPAFVPITTVSIIICYTYICGLLNILRLSVFLMIVLGLFLFFVYSFKIFKKQFNIKVLFCPGIIIFMGFSIYFFLILHGVSLLHYDNFSHWGTIIKEMFYFNSFPDERTIIMFRNYPPGTACLIYPVCKILGYSESHALMAQFLIISSAISTLFCKVKFKNISYFIALIITSFCSIAILSYDNTTLNIYNLLVDAVLAYVVVASLIVSYYYKDNIKKLFLTNIVLLSALVLIKDSGSLFLIVICMATFILTANKFKFRKKEIIFYNVLLILVPIFLSRVLWKAYNQKAYLHVDFSSNKFAFKPSYLVYVKDKIFNFSSVSVSKYVYLIVSMVILCALLILLKRLGKRNKKINSAINMFIVFGVELFSFYFFIKITNLIGLKSTEELNGILEKMFESLIDFSRINTKILFGVSFISVLSIVFLIVCKKDYNLILKTFLFTISLGIFYLLDLYILYAVIMNKEEGNVISAFDRYFSTFIIVLFLMQTLAIAHKLCTTKVNRCFVKSILCLLVIFSVLSIQSNIMKLIKRPDNNEFTRHYIQKICEDKKEYLTRDQNTAIYIGDVNSSLGYYYYLCTYELLSKECKVLNDENINENDATDKIKNSKYLIIAKDNEEFWKSIKCDNIEIDDYYGQIYSISTLEDRLFFHRIDN